MKINEDFSIGTHHPCVLLIGIELPTIYAPVKYSGARLILTGVRGIYQALQFFHE
jgi:hypothetical protein